MSNPETTKRTINWPALKQRASKSKVVLIFVSLLPLYCLASSIYLYKNQELTAETSSRVVLVLGTLSAVFLLVCIGIYGVIAAKQSQTSAVNVTFLSYCSYLEYPSHASFLPPQHLMRSATLMQSMPIRMSSQEKSNRSMP